MANCITCDFELEKDWPYQHCGRIECERARAKREAPQASVMRPPTSNQKLSVKDALEVALRYKYLDTLPVPCDPGTFYWAMSALADEVLRLRGAAASEAGLNTCEHEWTHQTGNVWCCENCGVFQKRNAATERERP